MNKLELQKLEQEFEKKLEGQNKPNKNDWIPYKQFIKQNKNNVKSSSKLDYTTKQLNKVVEWASLNKENLLETFYQLNTSLRK